MKKLILYLFVLLLLSSFSFATDEVLTNITNYKYNFTSTCPSDGAYTWDKALDNSYATFAATTGGNCNCHLTLNWSIPVIANKTNITQYAVSYMVNHIAVMGSNDGSTWTLLTNRTDDINTSYGKANWTVDFNNSDAYTYYRYWFTNIYRCSDGDKPSIRGLFLYNGTTPSEPSIDTLNISSSDPIDNYNSTTQSLVFNISVNASNINSNNFNCSLYINNTYYGSKNNTPYGLNLNVTIPATLSDGLWSWFMNCSDGINISSTSPYTLYVDSNTPSLVDNFINNSHYYLRNLTGQFNFSDALSLHSVNISIDDTVVFNTSGIANAFYSYNLTYNISSLSVGAHSLYIKYADGHTDNEIEGESWEVDSGLIFHDAVKYSFKAPYSYGSVEISQKDGSLLDVWDTEEKVDRFVFNFKPYSKKNLYNISVKAEGKIYVVNKPESKYGIWLIYDNHWLDFYPYKVNRVVINGDNEAIVEIDSKGDSLMQFESIGDLNEVSINYTFYVGSASYTFDNPVVEYQSTTFRLYLNNTGLDYTNATFTYNTSNKAVSKDVGVLYDLYTVTFDIPNIGNNVNTSFKWEYNLTGAGGIEQNSITDYQQILSIGIDNCSTYTLPGMNFTLINSTNNAIINSSLRANLNIFYSNISLYKTFNLSWNPTDGHNSICIYPNYTLLNISGQLKVDEVGLTNSLYYYLTNNTISNVTQFINLYYSDGATSVTFTVYDENGNTISNAYISILYYDFNTDTYYTSQTIKTDSQGKAIGLVTLSTVWYKFIVNYNGRLFDYEPTKLITTTYSLKITLGTDYYSSYDEVNGINCHIDYYNLTNCFSYTYSNPSGSSVTGCLDIYRISSFGKTMINTSCAVPSASGVVNLCIDENVTNKQYTAEGRITTSSGNFLCISKSSTKSSFYKEFGEEGILFTFMLMLVLIMIGIWHPVIAVAFAVIALVTSVIIGLFSMSWGAIITIIILGIITIMRLNKE
jgi:hypothetical protein